jgi:hypothetical protein
MNPGVYILDAQGSSGTGLTVKHTTLTDGGAGVTLVFTCHASGLPCNSSQWPSTMMALDSNSTICATAPAGPTTTNPTAGFVIMGDPAMPLNTTFSTAANSGPNYFNGTVWVPNGSFSWSGNSATVPCSSYTSSTTFCLQLIANQILLGGDSAFGGTGCSLSGGGTGAPVQKPIGSSVTLVD